MIQKRNREKMNDLFLLEDYIREALLDEASKKKKRKTKNKSSKSKAKGPKKGSKGSSSKGNLSKATLATLKKKAEKRGFTPSSVYAEFRKGLAAYYSSGSRSGMTPQQWAHARVNSATPSKPWAVVKKSKSKKK